MLVTHPVKGLRKELLWPTLGISLLDAPFPLYKIKTKHRRLKPAALSVRTWWPMTESSEDTLGSGTGDKREVLP